MSVSIAMAVFNGEKYLKEQIDSILCQLKDEDELVISYQECNDNSLKIINEYLQDIRVKLFICNEKGLLKNFENALNHCRSDIIFLSDQDDIWYDKKIKKISNIFDQNKDINVILHDADIFVENKGLLNETMFNRRDAKIGLFHNFIKNGYTGCCMAMRKDFLKEVLPFPSNVPMHDQWIGLVSELKHSSCFLCESLIQYRRHDGNVSSFKRGTLRVMISKRLILIKLLLQKAWVYYEKSKNI